MLILRELLSVIQDYNDNLNSIFMIKSVNISVDFGNKPTARLFVYRGYLTSEIKDHTKIPRFERDIAENTLDELREYLDCQLDNACLNDVDVK